MALFMQYFYILERLWYIRITLLALLESLKIFWPSRKIFEDKFHDALAVTRWPPQPPRRQCTRTCRLTVVDLRGRVGRRLVRS